MAGELDRLRAVIEAMTARPWVVSPENTWEHAMVEDAGHTEGIALAYGGQPGLGEHRGTRNARGIAALRNVAPELLAALQAAEDRDPCGSDCRVMRPYRGCTCGGEALRAALDPLYARIREAVPEVGGG